MSILQILILAVVQGLAEMLPVSSSAHVILTQKLMGLDPSAPEMTFLLVMLHTGTMVAALIYFGKRWLKLPLEFFKRVVLATACTGVLGLGFKIVIEKVILEKMLGHAKGEVEALFKNLPLIGAALLAAGIFIIYASRHEKSAQGENLSPRQSIWIGLIQGLCLPFRGFSRSGATISTGLVSGVSRRLSEEFSFALAVVLTPPVIFQETHRLMKSVDHASIGQYVTPGLIGMVFSFAAAMVALKLLSSMLERGRWIYFGYYCIAFSCVVFAVQFMT